MGLGNCQNLMSLLQKEYNIETFIETGTFQGGTAVWASNLFKNVFTIELCQQFYESTSKNYEHIQNIQFLYGHTTEHLKAIVPQLQGSALFWLDAHWSGGITAGQEEECPILEELQIIKASEWEHFILIDDARMFLSPPHAPHQLEQWPAIHEVIEELLTFKRQYIVVIEDAIISVPERAKSVLGNYCQKGITKVWEEYARSFHTLGYPISFENSQPTPVVQTAIAPQAEPDNLQFEGSGEAQVIRRFVTPGSVVLDVGANLGDWTKAVLSICPDAEIHLFEPIPVVYKDLIKNLGEKFSTAQIIPNSFAIGNQAGVQTFYHYQAQSILSTFHRRLEVEKTGTLQQPQEIQVLKNTVDNYCIQQRVERINFLKIDVGGGELDVLKGAEKCLNKGKIDYIQFEYGGTYLDAKITLKETFEYLHKVRYVIFKIQGNSLEYKPVFEPSDENYEYSNYLAVNERFRANVLGEPLGLLDVPQLCRQHSITPRGIIHVGAHEGSEVEYYLAMGVQRVLFIEANPTVFERLQTNIAQYPNVQAVNYAISHENGTVTLRVTSFDQSSSILPLKHHLDIYPTIQETEQVTVPSRTLDTLLQELGLNPADFNILNIDIQGAELLALQGATNWLQYVEAINTEVNYKELYEGCALIDDLDEFLDQYGLQRVATTTPHPFWGDAFYLKKPLVTMSILSRARFGNQIFLYAALKIHQKEHDIRVETTPWLGQYLFGHHDPLISKDLPIELDSGLSILNGKEPFKNVEFGGPTYQVHTKYYAPYKDFFRSLFKPIPTIEAKMKEALQRLHERGKTIVGLHLRRGDYREPYADFMFYAPNSCYRNWLKGLWETLESPVLFIASDDLESMLEDFADYHPVTTKDLGIELPEASFYTDFYLLSHCDVLATSNSTFSFTAAMLNERCKFFFRPHLPSQKLIPFDPWDSEPLLWQGRGTWVESEGLDNKTGQNPVGMVNISPVITASLLGEASFGRLGNQIFQYAFLKLYALEHNLRVETPAWIGQYLFGHHDPLPLNPLPQIQEQQQPYKLSESTILNAKNPFKNVDFQGYFQFHTQYHARHKEYFCSLFKPVPALESLLQEALHCLRLKGKTVVGIHLRRGDYHVVSNVVPYLTVVPSQWYQEWLKGFWETLDEPVLFIASDEVEIVIDDFSDYDPITIHDLGIDLPQAPFYPDFHILSQCDVLAISNSTFSFAAAMLNERCKFFFRPHLQQKKLIPFDPWNSEPLLRDNPEQTENPSSDYLLQANLVESENSELLWGHHIDAPAVGKLIVSQVLIGGWVIGKQTQAVVVELIHQGQVIRQIPVGDIRTDVAQSYPDASFALESGYAALITVPETQSSSEIKIQVVLADQTCVKLGVIYFQPTEQKWSVVSIPNAKPRKQCELSICAIMKNEAPYLMEWLEFHKLVGVERFYLYNNNSNDETLDIIEPYVKSSQVILHNWPISPGQQTLAYEHCLGTYFFESQWIAFIDLDEFLYPTDQQDLKAVLKEFSGVPAVGVNMLYFGTSGHLTRPDGLQIENFTMRGSDDFQGNKMIKSIVRPDLVLPPTCPHFFPPINPETYGVTENQQPLLSSVAAEVSVQKLRINHYCTRSRADMIQKAMRGSAIFPWQISLEGLEYLNRNDIQDLTIQRFVIPLKQALQSKMSQSPTAQILNEKWGLQSQVGQLKIQLEQSQIKLYKFLWKKGSLHHPYFPQQSKMKWFFAINDESPYFAAYAQMLKVAVYTARQYTSLEPFCIYDGKENEVTEWMRNQGVTIIHHRIPHYEKLKSYFSWSLNVASGAFLRIEIPTIMKQYQMDDEYVLYTDCDVMFLNDVVDYLQGITCEYIAATPEHDPNDWSYLNSGVLYMNIKNLQKINQEFNTFIDGNLDKIMQLAYDQGAYNLFFVGKWDKLDVGMNWKSYWDLNCDAKMIHFHGPKPNQEVVHHLGHFANKAYWENTEIWKEKYQELAQNHNPLKIEHELHKIKSELQITKEQLEQSQSQFDEVLAELEEAHWQLHQHQQSKTDESVSVQ
ncbi:hypothetical protein PL11201_330027 [Planktothrix sp. PCC 11201]|nr:hypothetical protein PL11201_330027 [Planktothrix sp. PCC 11201]